MLDAVKRFLQPASRSDVPPFMVMDVVAAAARIEAGGGRVVHMEVGQPAAAAPQTALAAARAALSGRPIGYTETLGIPSLRARIARHYAEQYGLPIAPERVVVTTGSSAGFILAFLALFDPGARVAVATPGYPPYRHILSALGCESVLIETTANTRWEITSEMLLAEHARKSLQGVLIASPANPTGTMMDAQTLARLIKTAEDNGIRVISDEIYHGLDYTMRAETAARMSEHVCIINSFSKYFCMTGWRVGWMVVPPERSNGCSRTWQSPCPRSRRSRPKPHLKVVPKWKRSSTAIGRTEKFCSTDCPAPAWNHFCRRTARFISTPT
jgi:aspartate/methionine/tyrosine aminotransferase